MRNMKIGTKILSGFGAVILLIVIIGLVVVSTNTQTINNVNQIETASTLQTMTNEMLDHFQAARTQANIVYNVISEEANLAYAEHTNTVESSFSDIFVFIDANPSMAQFLPPLQDAHKDYLAWQDAVNSVIKYNNILDAGREQLIADGGAVSEISGILLDNQLLKMENSAQSGGSELQDTILRRSGRAVAADQVSDEITAFRLDMRTFIQTYDTTNLDSTLGYMDEAIRLAKQYGAESTSADDRENAGRVADIVSQYRDQTVEFGQQCDLSAASIAAAVPLGDSATQAVSSAVEALDSFIVKQIYSTRSSSQRALILVVSLFLVSLAAAITLAVLLVRSITGPIGQIIAAANAIAVGDMEVAVDYESRDELGILTTAFRAMAVSIAEQVACVERLSQGDYSFTLPVRSEKDTMGLAINRMIQKMNEVLNEVKIASLQVSNSSGLIAQASTGLATGSSQQAATIQELTAAVTQTQSAASDNARIAERSYASMQETRKLMDDCSEEMGQMLAAMNVIEENAMSISKVINVIDDIAFQTNILALNAAVEAARAGQHGKGFAVVADEVRNLASKSAMAAKETATLIERSTQSVLRGNQLVSAVNDGIREAGSLSAKNLSDIEGISGASELQSRSVEEISSGIMQLAAVMQANTATAQETAASSEEMAAQAVTLDNIVSRFRLADKKTTAENMPHVPAPRDFAESGMALEIC